MKQTSLLALALGAVLTFSPALSPAQEKQAEGRGRRSPEERLKQLAEALKLTDEQKTKLAPVLKEEAEKLRAVFADTAGSREEKGKKFQEARKEIATKVKAVLTPEQADQYDKFLAEQSARRKKQ
jgi:Spy/CpxP family protein refolding chaperone